MKVGHELMDPEEFWCEEELKGTQMKRKDKSTHDGRSHFSCSKSRKNRNKQLANRRQRRKGKDEC